GKKEQSLFEFPEGVDYPRELFDIVAAVCGLNRATMTLSERHIQCYEPDAAPEPPAHKDRFPSQVSVGLSIEIPDESSLVLYPYEHRGVNAFNKAADFSASLQPEERPEVVLKGAREGELKDRPRDVVMQAELFGEPPFGINALQFRALRTVDGKRSLAAIADGLQAEAASADARAALLYLAERGALELLG